MEKIINRGKRNKVKHIYKYLKNTIMQTQIKVFNFKLYIRTPQRQEFLIKSINIQAENYDSATNKLNKTDLPFHHFCTVECVRQ